jgi:hypothetical protein
MLRQDSFLGTGRIEEAGEFAQRVCLHGGANVVIVFFSGKASHSDPGERLVRFGLPIVGPVENWAGTLSKRGLSNVTIHPSVSLITNFDTAHKVSTCADHVVS